MGGPMNQQGPQMQQNPWAAATSQGGVPGSTSSMYPNQQQFAPKPMLSGGTGGAGFVGAAPQSPMPSPGLMQQPGRVFAGGPGGRPITAPVDPAMPTDLMSMFRSRY